MATLYWAQQIKLLWETWPLQEVHSKYNRCQFSKMADKSTHVKDIYLPGETVSLTKEDESSIDKIYLGPGLRKYGKEILVSKPGVMQKKKNPTTYWIDCHQKRVWCCYCHTIEVMNDTNLKYFNSITVRSN